LRIIVAGWLGFAGDDATCAEIIRRGADFIAASRREPGCSAYNWSVDPIEPGKIHVYEEWESEADLLRHFRDPSYLSMRAHLENAELSGFGVRIYSVKGIEPVYDDDGQPRTEIFGITLD
jgi:quinol monooxygenase YgiN